MYINFDKYQLVKPNDCDVNYIDIYENVLSEEKRKARFCGTATEPQKSDGSVINIRFHAKEGIIDKAQRATFNFEILFTAFRQSDKGKRKAKCEMRKARQNEQMNVQCSTFILQSAAFSLQRSMFNAFKLNSR